MTQSIQVEGGNIKMIAQPPAKTKRLLSTILGVVILVASAYVIYNSDKIVSTPLPAAEEPYHIVKMWQEVILSLVCSSFLVASAVFLLNLYLNQVQIALVGGVGISIILILLLSIAQSATTEPALVKWAQDRYGIILEDDSQYISKDIMTYTTLTGETGTATARKVEGGYLLYKLDGSKELPLKVDENK